MLIETGTRIDNSQLELNIIEIYFWMKKPMSCFDKKKNFFFHRNLFKKLEIAKNYFMILKHHIFKIFSKFGFFHPVLFINKPWVLYWLVNSFDLIYFHLKKSNFTKNVNFTNLFFSKLTLSGIFKNSISSIFNLYSFSLYFTIKKKKNLKNVETIFVKTIYYFLRSLIERSLLPRNSRIGDCDGRNLFCILTVSSLFGILTYEIEDVCFSKLRHLGSHSEGFSIKTFGSAHGALTYCWIGNFLFIDSRKKKIKLFLGIKNWINSRQNFFMFGFSGRLGKIPDSCYNFWIGASLIFLNIKLNNLLENSSVFCNDKIFNLFSDRCGKTSDPYHMCYSICGLAILNFLINLENIKGTIISISEKYKWYHNLSKLNPVFGIRESRTIQMFRLIK